VLNKAEKSAVKKSYSRGEYSFCLFSEGEYTFLCITDEKTTKEVSFNFIE